MYYTPVPNYLERLLTGGPALETPPAASSFTTLRMNQTITGYGYKASTVTDYLSLAVLFAHLLIALLHTTWTLYTRHSYACWDTITEMLVLAQQSDPAKTGLDNTCAGIQLGETFRKKVRIRVAEEYDSHAQLLFEQDGDGTQAVEVDEAYGGRDAGL